jgi:hypothetical protein
VVSVTGANRPYAACLTKLVELTVAPRRHMLAPGALVGGNQISRRVELLLRKERSISSRVSRMGMLVPLSVVLVAVMQFAQVSPVVAVLARPQVAAARPDEPQGGASLREQAGRAEYALTTAGESASAGSGIADETHQSVGAKQEVGGAGRVQAAGREALGANAGEGPAVTVLPSAVNAASGQGAQTRTQIAAPAEDAGSASLLQRVAEITSDGEKAQVLVEFIEARSSVAKLPEGFFETFGSLNSSGEQRRVMSALLSKRLSRNVLVSALGAVAEIRSDGEKAVVLMQAAKVCTNDAAVISAYLNAVRAMDSSFEKERSLMALLQRDDLSRANLLQTLELAKNDITSKLSRQNVVASLEARLAQ